MIPSFEEWRDALDHDERTLEYDIRELRRELEDLSKTREYILQEMNLANSAKEALHRRGIENA